MSKPKFEVFLGTYNAAPWITGVIKSLEQQTCDPFTVNIIDNGSSDGTIQIIEELFSKFKMRNDYKLIKNSVNIGPMSTFLDRLDIFNHEWIFMVHQDDFYHPNHFETLIEGISNASESTSIVFTAMKRIDENNKEIFSTPTLSSQISDFDRLKNVLLTLQINPINYPACALRKSALSSTQTTRHTTAFNDTEMLLRLMCVSDVKYIPQETMHYRIHTGNASVITKTFANSYAVFVGLIEFFHSNEFEKLVLSELTETKSSQFFQALNTALEIRIVEVEFRNLVRGIIAERMIRILGYEHKGASDFLLEAQNLLGLISEAKVIKNLASNRNYQIEKLDNSGKSSDEFSAHPSPILFPAETYLVSSINKLNLRTRELIYNGILRSPFSYFTKRPFAKVWRKTK